MSDDISVAPEVQAALESNRHQQIVLFVYVSINGHSEEGSNRERWREKKGRGKKWQERMETSCRVSPLSRCCFIKTPKLSGQVSGEQPGT